MARLITTDSEGGNGIELDALVPRAPGTSDRWERIFPHLVRVRDTCNVYVLHDGRRGVAVDFGSGLVLDLLAEIGLERITDVVMTHHHRDQAQGLPRAGLAGIRIWVPPVERDLFAEVSRHWQERRVMNNYNTREDRFSLLEDVPVGGILPEYRTLELEGHRLDVVPTPGHTIGSVSFLTEIDGRRVAFSGDLLAAPGKVWSLAATQWTYNGGEGIGATILSLNELERRGPDLVLPSHGEPMADPAPGLRLLAERLSRLKTFRDGHPSPFLERVKDPYRRLSQHLLANLTSNANSYVLLSDSGKALVIDYGYDASSGMAAGHDRAARRPWLYTIGALKEQYGVDRVDVAIPTHYHDDHVAGFNLLREVEGTHVWAAATMQHVLENPRHYDLPCLWYDPITVDRAVPVGRSVAWEEYEITLHELPGHTLYAVAIEFEVDDRRVLAVGDQLHDEGWLHYLFRNEMPIGGAPATTLPPPRTLNYVYANRFRISDYRVTAELYLRIRPDLMLYGHWAPGEVDDDYLNDLRRRGEELEQLHNELLAPEQLLLADSGPIASIVPYQSSVAPGEPFSVSVECRNPSTEPDDLCVRLVVPATWSVRPRQVALRMAGGARHTARFTVSAPRREAMRQRIAADLRFGARHWGQVAEALVSVN